MMVKRLIHWRFSRGWELFFLALMLGALMALFQETSILRTDGLAWRPHLIGSIDFSGVWALWITVVVFHVALFTVIARSVIVEGRNRTANWLDFVAGFVGVVGIYFILLSTIYLLHRGLPNIEFLWNISSIALLRIGFILEAIITLYFGFTE
jgi:hypothetical protein